jgi:transposase
MTDLHPLTAWRYRQTPPLSLRQAAKQLQVSAASMSRWERRVQQVADRLVPQVSKRTGIPARKLRPDLAELFG